MTELHSTNNIRLNELFERSVDKYPHHIALICDDATLTYQELEWRTNQFAHYLSEIGITETDQVGIFLERSVESYIAILAILKTGATYVPIEIDYPDERVNFILSDMPFHSIITSLTQFNRHDQIQFPNILLIDDIKTELLQQPRVRLHLPPSKIDNPCYVIYTSGSTGKPKGVEISHQSICHYVTEASKLYQMTPQDRVYQGFSLAFDASMEELWMAFANGATLVACTSKDIRSGVGLIDFLNDQKITFFSTVPTLLSTLEGDLSLLRLLILGGEACRDSLVKKWSRPGLRIINTYGPTEATVIATYAECYPDKPVTIGKPLNGYEILILDKTLQPVKPGESGELCIGGVALANGYVNKPTITAEKFITNPNNNTQRLYRTGDLATINSEGNIEFLGRMDSQIKLRGFRIELDEIETVIMEYPAIKQGVVALKELGQPSLVAYLQPDDKTSFDLKQFKLFLERKLPYFMRPSIVEMVDSFPLLSSGKVDRHALPNPTNISPVENYIAPTTDLERQITTAWEDALEHQSLSIEHDFFYDFGGHSLTAAKIVSKLRGIPSLKNISILDIYENPTIKQLAKKFQDMPAQQTNNVQKTMKYKPSTISYSLCALGQVFGCLIQHAISAWQLLTVVICYAWVTTHLPIFSIQSLLVFLALFLGMPIASLAFTICAKWILVGRIKPGVYKLWGWFYLRWWLVERLQNNIFSAERLIGSPLVILYYRLLGAKIGKNCYIGTAGIAVHDVVTIGDNSSIGFDARLTGYVVEDGWLKIGTITIGNDCFVGARSVISINTILQNNSRLDDMSMLPVNRHIPANQFYSGSPATRTTCAVDHITNQSRAVKPKPSSKNFIYGLLHYFSLVFTMVIYFTCYLPALLIISHFHDETEYLFIIFMAAPVAAILFLGLYYISVSLCKKMLMAKITPGIYPLNSLHYLRQWTIVKMLDVNEIFIMADTLYFPYLLRFLGAKLGKRVEMGEAPHLIPDLITIQDEGFTASAVALAWPCVYQGVIKYAPVHVGKRGFVGNDSLLPLGTNLGDGGLLGCMSITPPNNQAANHHTAWLGSPAVFLPKRELFSGYSDEEKFTPSNWLVCTRLAIELIRIILPTSFTLLGLYNMLYVINILLANYSLTTIFLILPGIELLLLSGLVSAVVVLKWVLLGKLKPTTKPIWNIFIWKNDVVKYLENYFVSPHFTNFILGTPFAAILFRSLGAKIGKRVYIDSDDIGEYDLLTIGDDVCINSEAVIQTHLYEDRIFKMSTIQINDGCNIGVASIVLYSTVMEKNASLGNFSLMMKGEHLPENTHWYGIPAQPMNAAATVTPDVLSTVTLENPCLVEEIE